MEFVFSVNKIFIHQMVNAILGEVYYAKGLVEKVLLIVY